MTIMWQLFGREHVLKKKNLIGGGDEEANGDKLRMAYIFRAKEHTVSCKLERNLDIQCTKYILIQLFEVVSPLLFICFTQNTIQPSLSSIPLKMISHGYLRD
ncbi:hypothetical protein ACJX0J_040577 [Zea mays]